MAHSKPKSISIKEIAEKTGFSVRQMQRLAAKGGADAMPSVELNTDGYHRRYLLTPELRKWIAAQRKRSKGRQKRQGGKPVIEKHDGGTETFGVPVNRIVVLNGKMERADYYAKQSVEKLYGIHRVLFPVVKVWAGIVRRIKGKLPPDLEAEFRAQLKELII